MWAVVCNPLERGGGEQSSVVLCPPGRPQAPRCSSAVVSSLFAGAQSSPTLRRFVLYPESVYVEGHPRLGTAVGGGGTPTPGPRPYDLSSTGPRPYDLPSV